MSELTQLAAFVEYVCRPLTEDIRLILEKVQELNIPLTGDVIKNVAVAVGLWHVLGELIRGLCFITITWIICRTVASLLPLL